jgi:hypothetical protein
VTFPTDAKLLNRAREKLVRLAQRHGVVLRQSYAKVGKFALIQHQRYAHAKQFKRANRMLKKLRTFLGRVIRDIAPARSRATAGLKRRSQSCWRGRGACASSSSASAGRRSIPCTRRKSNAHRPYEFGVKVSVATTLKHGKGGQFVTHVKALPGNPYDGHTLATVIPDMEALVGSTIARILADKGYRGHNAPPDYKFRVFLSGQKRGVTPAIKRELRRGSAVEPVIGHLTHGPQLSLVPSRRRHQRRPRRRRLQLAPPDPLAQDFVVANPQCSRRRTVVQSSPRTGFFTDDVLASRAAGCPGMSEKCHLRTPALQQTPPYSITSSASAVSVAGISSPIDFAVFKLMTNW